MFYHVSHLSLFHIEKSFSHSSRLQIQDRWLASSRVYLSIGMFIIYIYGCSENRGTLKSSILTEISSINYPFWGTAIFGKHIYIYILIYIYMVPPPKKKPTFLHCLLVCTLFLAYLRTFFLLAFLE